MELVIITSTTNLRRTGHALSTLKCYQLCLTDNNHSTMYSLDLPQPGPTTFIALNLGTLFKLQPNLHTDSTSLILPKQSILQA